MAEYSSISIDVFTQGLDPAQLSFVRDLLEDMDGEFGVIDDGDGSLTANDPNGSWGLSQWATEFESLVAAGIAFHATDGGHRFGDWGPTEVAYRPGMATYAERVVTNYGEPYLTGTELLALLDHPDRGAALDAAKKATGDDPAHWGAIKELWA